MSASLVDTRKGYASRKCAELPKQAPRAASTAAQTWWAGWPRRRQRGPLEPSALAGRPHPRPFSIGCKSQIRRCAWMECVHRSIRCVFCCFILGRSTSRAAAAPSPPAAVDDALRWLPRPALKSDGGCAQLQPSHARRFPFVRSMILAAPAAIRRCRRASHAAPQTAAARGQMAAACPPQRE
jgi:hypothetical protein